MMMVKISIRHAAMTWAEQKRAWHQIYYTDKGMYHLSQVHNMTLDLVLCCVLTLVAMQHEARMDSQSMLAFPALCPGIRSQKFGLELVIFACPKLDAMQRNTRSWTSVNIVSQSLHS